MADTWAKSCGENAISQVVLRGRAGGVQHTCRTSLFIAVFWYALQTSCQFKHKRGRGNDSEGESDRAIHDATATIDHIRLCSINSECYYAVQSVKSYGFTWK